MREKRKTKRRGQMVDKIGIQEYNRKGEEENPDSVVQLALAHMAGVMRHRMWSLNTHFNPELDGLFAPHYLSSFITEEEASFSVEKIRYPLRGDIPPSVDVSGFVEVVLHSENPPEIFSDYLKSIQEKNGISWPWKEPNFFLHYLNRYDRRFYVKWERLPKDEVIQEEGITFSLFLHISPKEIAPNLYSALGEEFKMNVLARES